MVCGVLEDVGMLLREKRDFSDAKMFQVQGTSRSSNGGDFLLHIPGAKMHL